jgi:hypothetical protein
MCRMKYACAAWTNGRRTFTTCVGHLSIQAVISLRVGRGPVFTNVLVEYKVIVEYNVIIEYSVIQDYNMIVE